jgi:hypothetical protein
MRKFLDDAGYLDTESEHVPSALERWYLRSLDEPSGLTPTRGVTAPEVAQVGGFTVHAGVTVARGDARGREQLCRYITRPPFSERQLARTSDGRVELTLRKPANNGQRKILLEPVRGG